MARGKLIVLLTLFALIFIFQNCKDNYEFKERSVNYRLKFNWQEMTQNEYQLSFNGSTIAKLHITQNWIYFNDVNKNSTLKLIAANESMAPLSISWPSLRNYIIKIDSISFKQTKDSEASIEFWMLLFDNLQNKIGQLYTKLLVGRNTRSEFFEYSVTSTLSFESKKQEMDFFTNNTSIEYQDILNDGIVSFFPPKNLNWKYLVYKDPKNILLKLPLNHHNIYNNLPIKTKDRIYFALEEGHEGNPIFKLNEKTASNSYFILCTWAYDLHMFFDINTAKTLSNLGLPIVVNYTLTYLSSREISSEFENAIISPIVESKPFKTPAYSFDHFNDFEKSDLYRIPNEHYFWYAFQDTAYCEWDQKEGYKSNCSLRITNNFSRISSWKYAALSENYLSGFVLKGRYQISAMVKAQNAIGKIKLGYQNYYSSMIEFLEYPVNGNIDWTPISIETSDTTGQYMGIIYLELDGSGSVWFDNVKLSSI